MKRRIIAALMCLCMLVGLLPMSAFAAPAEPGPLKPSDKYYKFDGELAATAERADITLSKTAVDNENGTYDVTLTAQAKDVVMAKATEVVFVIDGSGSMRHCVLPENGCNHNDKKGDWCEVTEDNHAASRWNIALNAIGTMRDKLGEEGVSYRYVVYQGHGYKKDVGEFSWDDSGNLKKIPDAPRENGFTYLSAGVERGLTCFDEGRDTNKVMIIVADGASTDGYPKEKEYRLGEEKLTDFGKFKQNGGKVYTVGFTFSNQDFKDLATDLNHHFLATDERSLNISMEKISENIKGLITDPMGGSVKLDSNVTVEGSDVNATVTGSTINWTDELNGLKDSVSLKYTVKIKDGVVQHGKNTIPLNGTAQLNYRYGDEYNEVNFPVPVAEFDAATLQVEYYYNGAKIADGLETPEWVNIAWNNAAFETAIPSVGDTYQHGRETYYVSQVTGAPGETLEAKAYTVRVDLTEDKPPVYAPASVTKTPVIAESVTLTAPGAEKTTTLTQGTDYIKVEQKDGAYVATAGVDENSATVLFAVTVTATDAGLVDVTDADATYKGMSGTAAAASVGQDGKVTLTFTGAGTVTLYFSETATFETNNTVTVSNTVAVKDGDGDDTNDTSTSEVEVTKTEAKPSLTVNKTYTISRGGETVTGNAKPGDVLTYTITVTNNGNVELSSVTVKDTFTGAKAPDNTWTATNGKFEKTWTIASLAVDASSNAATYTYTYTVRAADQGKTITNNAVAKSGTTEGGDTTTVTVYNPDMAVTKAVTKVNNTEVAAGETVVVQKDDVLTYTITVKNTGDQDLTNVVVTDTKWSDGTKITVSGVNNPVTLTGDSYIISALDVGNTVTITYTYPVTDADVTAGEVTNNVSVTSNETSGGESRGTTTKVVGNYTIEASSGANGTISPNGSVTVAAGTDKTFTITADVGYHISDVTVDNKSVGVQSEYKFENVWGNHTIHATFAKNSNPTSYTLYYHSNFGEDIYFYQSSSTRNMTVKEYENVGRLPERDGYVFVSWNTEPDGSGSRYMPGDPFRIEGSSDRLYAQWQKDKTGPDDSGVSNWLETDDHNAYLTGYPDSTFRADRNMTRAEVAQMFYALLLDKNVTITKSFSDVPDDAWYATAVKTLASLGMMDGYPDGTFRPDEPITRAEFATVGLAFAYDPLDADCSYYDVSASAWYHTYVAQATTYGWIGGYPDNTFRPGNNITRVEVCVIVNNMLGRDADERYIDRHEDELVHFVDLSDSYWGYYTIMEATNTHEYTGSFTNEKWTDVK